MSDHLNIFQTLRPRLFGIAYRMLGTRVDAEDVLQEAWLRWEPQTLTSISSHEAWLVTTVSRLAIDRLRQMQSERVSYTGSWLPEPLVEPMESDTPERLTEVADDLSVAFLYLLERLKPEERVAYLLRQVFDHDYADVASLLGKTEAACRQLVHRATDRLREDRPRVAPSREQRTRLLQQFVQAAQSGQREALKALMAADVELVSDGGGKVPAVLHPLLGPDRIADLMDVVHRRYGDGLRYEVAFINGEPGLVRYLHDQIESVQAVSFDGEQIAAIYAVRNPDKLTSIPPCHNQPG